MSINPGRMRAPAAIVGEAVIAFRKRGMGRIVPTA